MKTLINRCLSLIVGLAILAATTVHAQVNYDKITYIHSDASGTPIAASDEQGNIVWTIDHYPYGAEYSNDANNRAGTLSFAGKAYDEETGLSYFGGRWYNAHIGRFMGIDPAPVNSEDWRSFNRYSYGFNNPYKYIDPDGWEPVDPHADTDGDGTPNFAEASYVKFDTVLGAGLNVSHGTLSIGLGMANGKVGNTLQSSAASKTQGVSLINGRKPINSKYAGQTHPSGIKFNEKGFPDFSDHVKAQVEIKGLTGNYAKDAALANKAVGLQNTPKGFVWHHVEDAKTMQLISKDIHNATRHTGGAAILRKK